ncbi:MAG: hypothetical protein IPH48_19980 [bacterium]|nr:hypothetical protein [bacterium]
MCRPVIVALFLASSLPAVGATLYVEQDGSAPYTTIQAAVDAAASGDTIRIGPGRYNDGRVVTTPGWSEFVRVLVRQFELTLIGSGHGVTIMGPSSPWDLSQGWNIGIRVGPHFGNQHVQISDIGFENMGYALAGAEAPESAVVTSCRFLANAYPVYFVSGGSLELRDTAIDLGPRDVAQVLAINMQDVLLTSCEFSLAAVNNWNQTNVHLEGVSHATVVDCSFQGGFLGLGFFGVDSGTVSNSTFSSQIAGFPSGYARGLHVGYSSVRLSDCVFVAQNNAMSVWDGAEFHATRASVLDASVCSLNLSSPLGPVTVNESQLAHGENYTVWEVYPCVQSTEPGAVLPILDLTHNDWGTSDADIIASWIRTCSYVAEYFPFVGQPVATESTTWGDLKASFR